MIVAGGKISRGTGELCVPVRDCSLVPPKPRMDWSGILYGSLIIPLVPKRPELLLLGSKAVPAMLSVGAREQKLARAFSKAMHQQQELRQDSVLNEY